MDLWKQVLNAVVSCEEYCRRITPLLQRLMHPSCNRLGQKQDRMTVVGVTFNDRSFSNFAPIFLAAATGETGAPGVSDTLKALCWIAKEVLIDRACSQPTQAYEERCLRVLLDIFAPTIIAAKLPYCDAITSIVGGAVSEAMGEGQGAGSFRRLPSSISIDDICRAKNLREANLHPPLFGADTGLHDYLESWFRLLQMDMALPVAKVIASDAKQETNYSTLFVNLKLSDHRILDIPRRLHEDVGIIFDFDVHEDHPKKRTIDRHRMGAEPGGSANSSKASKDLFGNTLQKGSLVGFIGSLGELVRLAVVAGDSERHKGKISVYFPDQDDLEATLEEFCVGSSNVPVYKLLHLSSSHFNNLPVIRRLQRMLSLPFERQIVAPGSVASGTPQYFGSSSGERNMHGLEQAVMMVGENERQAAAVRYAMENAVALIQGPPGTGKTFVGMVICKHILTAVKDAKILCVCKTNHAVDAFVELLVRQKLINASDGSVLRIGGRSASATLESAGIYSDVMKERASKSKTRGQWNRIDDLRKRRSELRTAICKQEKDLTAAMRGLPYEELRYLFNEEEDRQFTVPETEDGFQLVLAGGRAIDLKPDTLWKLWLDGRPVPPQMSCAAGPLWTKSHAERQAHHQAWLVEHTHDARLALAERFQKLNLMRQEENELIDSGNRSLVETARVIACTSWGAAQHAELLDGANITTVVIEEAAELLEPSAICAIPASSSKHLVLIGDHQQLRPNIESHELTVASGNGLNLNMSLFERLFHSRLNHVTLTTQHRMRPEISAFGRELFYPELIDHEDVKHYPDMKGMGQNVIFIDTPYLEDAARKITAKSEGASKGRDNRSSSSRNQQEAVLVAATARHLLSSGHSPEDIVILAPYSGQLLLLRTEVQKTSKIQTFVNVLDEDDLLQQGFIKDASELRNAADGASAVRISTIDNFQGEEADIVLVSLTRSNKQGMIGFLQGKERVNVLLSRAKHGMILFGNRDTLIKCSLWEKILHRFETQASLLPHLNFKCERHGAVDIDISDPNSVPEGGCGRLCGAVLPCGHPCEKPCHSDDRNHKTTRYACTVRVYARCEKADHFLLVPCRRVEPDSRASETKIVVPRWCQDCLDIDSAVKKLKALTLETELACSTASAEADKLEVLEQQRYQVECAKLEKTSGTAAAKKRLAALEQKHSEYLERRRAEQKESKRKLTEEFESKKLKAIAEASQLMVDIERQKERIKRQSEQELEVLKQQQHMERQANLQELEEIKHRQKLEAMFHIDVARRDSAVSKDRHEAKKKQILNGSMSINPSYWTSNRSTSPHLQDVTKSMLPNMQQLVDSTLGPLGRARDQVVPGRYTRFEVVKVQRVENPSLWKRYYLKRTQQQELAKTGPKVEVRVKTFERTWQDLESEANEVYLFHGTKPTVIRDLCTFGFNERFGSLGGLYGAGTCSSSLLWLFD